MNLEEYAWNKHEQKIKAEQKEFTYSSPKIKITDNSELRNEIEAALEKMSHKLLAQWALKVAANYLNHFDSHLKHDPRINLGIETLERRIEGNIRAHELRKVGFVVNELAKESKTDVSKYSARSFAQAIATGHMRGHALVSSDYAIKVENLLTEDDLAASRKERERQLKIIDELLNKRS